VSAFDDVLGLYDYAFPDELIAHMPASPRDGAKLAVLDRKTGGVEWVVFRDADRFLPENALLVLNETKVVPARLRLRKATGGRVEVLSLGAEGGLMRVMADRKLKPGETLTAEGDDRKTFEVTSPSDRYWLLKPLFPMEELDALLRTHGDMPLPPYIDASPLSRDELKERYQSVFAKHEGSIAAPTASLHFTPELLASLEASGVGVARVTLHVHLGTFARLTEEQWRSGRLHRESYAIPPESARLIEEAKCATRPVVAVGTTAVRTLESAFDADRRCVRPEGMTDLFIREPYDFKMVDAVITNFHVPKSSLLMLVCAFAGRERVLDLYRQAIERRMRLFSFGDAMLIV
jgi:S-adenosylmethionine:tRNA ribosyltransferase-isomerase